MIAPNLNRGIHRVVLTQAALTLGVAALFWALHGGFDAAAALYGGAVAIGLAAWLGWQIGRVNQRNAGSAQLGLYMGAGVRLLAVLILLALGLGGLKLAALPLLVGFAIAQFGYLVQLGRSV